MVQEEKMKLSRPKESTFIIAVILAVLALLGSLTPIAFVSTNAFWILLVGFILLALGNLYKGL
jgi:type IV secretory pathway VirB3-like protein